MTGHRLRADTPTGQCYPSGAYKLAEIYGNLDRKRLDKLLNLEVEAKYGISEMLP